MTVKDKKILTEQMSSQAARDLWLNVRERSIQLGYYTPAFILKKVLDKSVGKINSKLNLTVSDNLSDGKWTLSAENWVPISAKMIKDLTRNKTTIEKHIKSRGNVEIRQSLGANEIEVGRGELYKFSELLGIPKYLVDLDDHIVSGLKSGLVKLTKKTSFTLDIPGPGFSKPVGNPKGRKKAKFMVTKRKEYAGASQGDFSGYEQKLLKEGFTSFDAFYQALINCFGEKWLSETGLELHGMDYKFRDEHEKAFNKYLENKAACPSKTGKPPMGADEPDTPAAATTKKKKIRKASFPPGSIFIAAPQHASCRIHEASNTLTYGEHDPLGIYGSKTPIQKLPLNETINEIFGYSGGWKEYHEKNYEDITKKTTILKKDGRRVEFERPQDWTYEEGDRVIQMGTLWPFHVYFAFKEKAELQGEAGVSYKNIFVQITKENLQFLKNLPEKILPKIYYNLKDRYPLATDSDLKARAKTLLEKIFYDWDNFIKKQHLFSEKSEYFKILTQRMGLYGLVDHAGVWGAAHAESHVTNAIHNPPEGIANKTIIENLVRGIPDKEGKRKGGLYNLGGEVGAGVFSPDGLQLIDDHRAGKRTPMAPQLVSPGTEVDGLSPVNIKPSAGVALGKTKGSLIIGVAVQHGVISADDGVLGVVIHVPTNNEAFTEAEKIFFKRIGINSNSPIRFDPLKNKFNTQDGKYVKPGDARSRDAGAAEEDEPAEKDSGEQEGAGDYGGAGAYGGAMALSQMPDEFKDTQGASVEELLARRAKFCNDLGPEKRKGVWFCGWGAEADQLWHDVLTMTKEAVGGEPSRKKIDQIRSKVTILKRAATKKPKLRPARAKKPGKIWWGPFKKFTGTTHIDVKREHHAWAHVNSMKFLASLSKAVEQKKGNLSKTKWYVEDISLERNGKKYIKMGGHRSHSLGLDIDISIPTDIGGTKGQSITKWKKSKLKWGYKKVPGHHVDIPAAIDFFRQAYRSGAKEIYWDNSGIRPMKKVLTAWLIAEDEKNKYKEPAGAHKKSFDSFGKLTLEEYNWINTRVKNVGGHRNHFHVRMAQDVTNKGKYSYEYVGKDKKTKEMVEKKVETASWRYYDPKAVQRARAGVKESLAKNDLTNFVKESLNKLIQDINEGKEHELADQTLQ